MQSQIGTLSIELCRLWMVNYGCLKVVQLVCIFKEQNRERAPPFALLAIQCRDYKENGN